MPKHGRGLIVLVLDLCLHTAVLDPETGCGLLLLPSTPDVILGLESLHAVDLDDAITRLVILGWDVVEQASELEYPEEVTDGGRRVIRLYGDETIAPLASPEQERQAFDTLRVIADELGWPTVGDEVAGYGWGTDEF